MVVNSASLRKIPAAHLRRAATEAGRRSAGDPFSPWHAYAGQLDLAATGLGTRLGLIPQVADHADVLTHLELASRALEQVPPGRGPTDVALWCWQLTELARAAKEMAAA